MIRQSLTIPPNSIYETIHREYITGAAAKMQQPLGDCQKSTLYEKTVIPRNVVLRAADLNRYDCQWQSYNKSMRRGNLLPHSGTDYKF